MTTAVCNVKDINDLDKNASDGGAETEVWLAQQGMEESKWQSTVF